ncbi:MAG: bifunctional shikimate kinase/3-dehydroquinate synthase [Kofleriaceae bacterium]|nr:bifunctional shikimate kinase/3-dehydroquinate synthase [Kofleriaceae bacterium]MBP9170032.1 bifunctional shikimate kinase/3-dehydroquinate synthase [Kofleriaceae bacterium]MBP9858267.1 bifunctional shikimate kinase/3-dehydroquinate synthase [Kofleriaceae bacterium]
MGPVFLIGFPGAGKSTVARLAAAALGRRAVDLDDAIAAAAGRTVPELVAADLADFRRREAAALAEVAAAVDAPVVAVGGGAPVEPGNLARMMAAGLVVALDVDLDVALARIAPGSRPLLDRPRAEVEARYAARAPVYRRAHATVAGGRDAATTAAELVALIARVEAGGGPRPWVALGDRSYPIAIGDGALADLVTAHLGPGRGALVFDRNLAPHVEAAVAALAAAGITVEPIAVEPGEASKSLAGYGALAEALIARGLDRGSTIYALGGGVIGDLAGFVAATLFRGVDVVHLPTTVVAMTDSAIGGKTAIDVAAGKNLLGAFHQPRAVIAHLPHLATLPPRERVAGFGELWKYALLDGEPLLAAVEAVAPWAATTAPPPPALTAVITAAATLKANLVSVDERERTGRRALLNLGHTVGHAIEAAADWRLLHGEAVALGLVAMARISARLGLAEADLEPRVVAALAATGLPTDLEPWRRPEVLARIAVDKKRHGAAVRFVACAGPGACRVVEVPVAGFADLLRP